MEKPHISLRLIHRLADHLESCNTFSLKKIKFLVLDEADRLLAGGGGFDEQVCVPQSCPLFNLLTPNDNYSGRIALLTSKCCILYIYSTNIGTEYFKHGIYSPLFPLQNADCFINLTYLVPVLFTFYIQGVLKLKKIILAPKG